MDNRNMINRVLVKRYYIKLQSKIKVMLLMRHMIFIYRDLKYQCNTEDEIFI